MPSSTFCQLTLEAAIDGPVIRGTLIAPTGEKRDFYGWLELNTALEAALGIARDEPGRRTGCRRSVSNVTDAAAS